MERDDLVSAEVVGEWVGIHARQVREYARRGYITRDGRGRYRLFETVRAIAVRRGEQAAGRASGDSSIPDLVIERALLARSQRVAQDLRNRTLQGDLVSWQDAEAIFGYVVHSAKVAFLALPSAVAHQFVGLRSAAEAHALLTAAIRKVLQRLSDDEVDRTMEAVRSRTTRTVEVSRNGSDDARDP